MRLADTNCPGSSWLQAGRLEFLTKPLNQGWVQIRIFPLPANGRLGCFPFVTRGPSNRFS